MAAVGGIVYGFLERRRAGAKHGLIGSSVNWEGRGQAQGLPLPEL